MKKIKVILSAAAICIMCIMFVAACGNTPDGNGGGDAVTVMRVVKFYSDDGFTLLAEKKVKDGETIVYDGDTPQKKPDEQFTYVFDGWAFTVGGAVMHDIKADKNIDLYAVFSPRALDREKVDKPDADTREYVYTGESIRYEIAAGDKYKITNAVKTDAGDYTVKVSLKDKTHTCWSDGTDADLEYKFVIAKADNVWTEEPNISDRMLGEPAGDPEGAAKFGSIVWTYGNSPDGEFTSEAPSVKGNYFAKATVEGTDNYNRIEKVIPFAVLSNTFTIVFVNADGSEIARREILKHSEIVYDGETPINRGDAQYGYTFVGWSAEKDGEPAALSADADMSVYAIYDRYVKSYTVVFSDDDGELERKTLEYGAQIEYTGATLGGGTGNIISEFVCWNDGTGEIADLPTVTGDANYTAVYRMAFNPDLGGEDYPYMFDKRSEMIFLSECVDSGYDTTGKYFALKSDIDLSDGFVAIGTQENMFKGHFDGNGHTLTLKGDSGVFGCNAGHVSRLNVSADVTGAQIAGGIAAFNYGTIRACKVSGSVSAITAGGIVGVNAGNVEYCRGNAVITADGVYAMNYAVGNGGGVIVGKSDGGAVIYADSVWDGVQVASGFASGTGTESDPYIIETADQLAYFKDSQTDNAYYDGKYVKLNADIDLADCTWSGIGGGSSSNGFKGTFDGNGHVVYNVALVYGKNKGFFNSATGAIKNLTLFGSVSGTSAVNYIGMLVAINGASIDNCAVYGNMETNAQYAALIAAWSYGDINNCTSYGYVKGGNIVGGTVGYDVKSGGVIGKLTGLKNYATVATDGDFAVANTSGIGGIAALVGSGAIVDNCFNYGSVIASSAASDGGTGGIVGNNF